MAGALDADPFSLLLLRGRRRDEVLAGLRARRRSAEATMAPADRSQPASDPGIDAREAYQRPPTPLPAPPLPPPRPGQPAVLPVDPPPGAGLRPEDLVALAADAAARAFQLATGSGDGGLSLDLDLTRGGLQLRLGGDGLWYRFVRSGGDWVLDGPPAPEPGRCPFPRGKREVDSVSAVVR